MNFEINDSTTLTWVIMAGIVSVAVAYSIIAINNKPPQMGFTPVEGYVFPYDIEDGGWRVELPDELEEVSGITSMNPDQVMAIQDEKGILYSVNLNTGNITSTITFDKDRDYEDLCLVGDHIFILERDGDLYQYHLAQVDSIHKFETSFSYRNDTESLCFDAKRNRLLMAPKEGAPEGTKIGKNIKGVYAFDILSKSVQPDPICTIAQNEIGRIIGNDGKPHKFKPSAMAIHPSTGYLYILASVGKVLIVVNPTSNQIMHVQLLSEEQFPQPEGLAFDSSDNLLIASEGVAPRAASITRFSPKVQ
ncbi:MAG: SdiA-regulated domain-containing protein [Bacteroidota bacterium]